VAAVAAQAFLFPIYCLDYVYNVEKDVVYRGSYADVGFS